jgi:thiol-disulfide isomerase/thioredoxin
MKKLFTILSIFTLSNLSFGQSSIANGATCPNFTVTDINGVSHSLYDYCDAGQYVMVDFFAYWCGPCAQIAPIVHNFYTKYGCNTGDVFVLGIESDANSTLAQLQTFKTNAGIPENSFPNVLGSQGGSGVRGQYGVSAFPTIILVGPDRKMINNDIWPISSVATFEAAFPAGSITPKSCSAASLDQNALEANLSIYPNPVSELLNIQVDYIQNVSIYDASGKTVFTNAYNNIDQIALNVSDFETGIYIVTVSTSNGVVTSRFVKK